MLDELRRIAFKWQYIKYVILWNQTAHFFAAYIFEQIMFFSPSKTSGSVTPQISLNVGSKPKTNSQPIYLSKLIIITKTEIQENNSYSLFSFFPIILFPIITDLVHTKWAKLALFCFICIILKNMGCVRNKFKCHVETLPLKLTSLHQNQ